MIHPLDLLDITIPGVFLAQAMGRWGNFVNQEAYGKIVSNLDWLPAFIRNQMFIDGHYRMPTFFRIDFLIFFHSAINKENKSYNY